MTELFPSNSVMYAHSFGPFDNAMIFKNNHNWGSDIINIRIFPLP